MTVAPITLRSSVSNNTVRPLPDPNGMIRTPSDPTEKLPPNIKVQHKAAKESISRRDNIGGRRLDFGV
jgi:hypothetical protein